MNKQLLAATTTSLMTILFPTGAQAQAEGAGFYARLNLGLEAVRRSGAIDGNGDGMQAVRESNYRSVLGLRGTEALGHGLRLVYQIEGALAPDTGGGTIATRDTRLGLEGAWGTLFAGNWTTPYTSSTSALDPFYPTTAGYMSIMGNGSAPSADNVGDTSAFDRRQQNSLHYWTPTVHGVSVRLAHGFNEERPAGGARPSLDSAAILFERGPLFATLAHERHRDYQGADLGDRGTKLALAWQFGPTRLAMAAERLRYRTASGALRRDAFFVSVTRQAGPHALRLAVAKAMDGKGDARERIGFIAAGPGSGALQATIGYDVALSKRTGLFVFHSRLRNGANAAYDFAINGLEPGACARLRNTAFGMRHAF